MPYPPRDASDEDLKHYYTSEFDFFASDLEITVNTPSDDLIVFLTYSVYRNVKLFIQHVKRAATNSKNEISLPHLIRFCLSDYARR